jgi:hypothetical protein
MWGGGDIGSPFLMEVYGQLLYPAALPLVPFAQEAGWAPVPVWLLQSGEKSLGPAGSGTLVVQPVA